jgi:hypothetical protein
MNAAEPGERPWPAAPVLAGVGAGVLAAVALLFIDILGAAWRHQPWWLMPNLYATAFTNFAINYGAGWYTAAGIALQVLGGGVLGAFFGWLTRKWRETRYLVGGAVLLTLLWYNFWNQWMGRAFHMAHSRFSPAWLTMLGQLAFGLTMGLVIRFLWPVEFRRAVVAAIPVGSFGPRVEETETRAADALRVEPGPHAVNEAGANELVTPEEREAAEPAAAGMPIEPSSTLSEGALDAHVESAAEGPANPVREGHNVSDKLTPREGS